MLPPVFTYEPRPHRCELVREVNGVAYVNDSKATNLDAMDKALRAQTKPIILIAGGKDKGFSFDPLRPLVKEKVRSTILIGEMAEASGGPGLARSNPRSQAHSPTRSSVRIPAQNLGKWFFSLRDIIVRHVQKLRRSRRSISRARPRVA
jgi:UDP-N-acetylmuramoylalanine-D-glutamate ligase